MTEKKERTNEEIELEEVEHQSKEMWLTNVYVDKPCVVILITIVLSIICGFISVAIDGFKQADPHDREYLIWSNERVEDFDMFMLMRKRFLQSQVDTTIPVRSQYVKDWNTNLVMKCDDCDDKNYNVLTAENLKALSVGEKGVLNQNWYKDFCLASVTSSECHPTESFISLTSQIPDIENLTDARLQTILSEIANDDAKFEEWKGFLGQEFNKNNLKSSVIRSQFKMGGPIKVDGDEYKDIYDDERGQSDHFEQKLCADLIDYFRDDFSSPSGVLVFPTSDSLHNYNTNEVVGKDFLLAVGSISFVLIYISIHLKSFYLGSQGMLNILYSFPLSMTIFNGIFQIDYFSTLHVLVIFIILGISADNIFVFVDCWNQAYSYELLKNNQKRRMAYTFRRASRAMLATSSTTCAAFLATGLSDIMPISSFGFFAGILVPVNFILVITYFPASLIVFEKYTKNIMDKCTNKKKETAGQDPQQPQQQQEQQQQSEEGEKKGHKIEKFFNDQVTTYTHKLRYPIMIIFAIWTGIGIWRASQLPGMSEQVSFLPDSYDAQQVRTALINDFAQAGNSDQGIKVYQYWGINGLDKSDASSWDPADIGKLEWDEEFDLSPTSNQKYFYDYCVYLKTTEIVQEGQVGCFMELFKGYVENKGLSFPVPQNEFLPELKLFVKTPIGQAYYNANFIGIFGDKLKYVTIQMSSHGRAWAPYSELNPYYEEWDEFFDEENKKAPVGLNNSKQTALLHWVFMITEKALVDNAIQGVLISLGFAFVVLLSTTHNIILALYSTGAIGGIVISVIGIIEMMGWELGVSESVAIVILIGLSVDYVVHLANHYVECVFTDRYRKTQVALRDLGISIVSGASTTLGSALFLFFATITLFNKFAVLIFATIILSLLYAIVLFSAVLHAFGPENGFGDLSKLFKKKPIEKVERSQDSKQAEGGMNAVHAIEVEQAKLGENTNNNNDQNVNNDDNNQQKVIVEDVEMQQPS